MALVLTGLKETLPLPQRHRILFVDDEIRVLEALRRSLKRHEARFDMMFLTDPKEAVAALRAHPAEVVVTDMKMPGMNGIEMVMAMRAAGARATYIVLTGTADLRTAIDAINRAEIFRFFTKPCPSFLLVEGIDAALASRAAAPTTAPQSALAVAAPVASSGSWGSSALDRLPLAVLVVDETAKVLFMNRQGAALAARGDGLSLGGGKVCRADSPTETARLHDLIRSAIAGGEGGVMVLTRAEACPLPVAVTALDEGGGMPRAALYISDPDGQPVATPEQLARLLDLTLAEARLAHALALGQSVEEAALTLGITTGTARGYLKQIFGKTGRSRQADLVRLVLGQPVLTD